MTAISSNDCVLPFYFRGIAARGAVVKLQNSFVEALNGHQYPDAINSLLGESLAASSLMSTHLKSSARLSIQARAIKPTALDTDPSPAVSMLYAETHMLKTGGEQGHWQTQSIRGLAHLNDSNDSQIAPDATHLSALLGRSQLAVTIEPDKGERYQGIVNAQSSCLAKSLEDYFQQSEQLATRFHLFTSKTQCAGLIIQEMPNHGGKSERHPIGFESQEANELWEELLILAGSIHEDELLHLTPEDCLHRLFHQHDYGLGEPIPVKFACSCSLEGTSNALKIVDYEELDAILREEGEVTLDCEFCSTRYRYDRKAIANIKGIPYHGDTIN